MRSVVAVIIGVCAVLSYGAINYSEGPWLVYITGFATGAWIINFIRDQ
jgi:hypothetical protein